MSRFQSNSHCIALSTIKVARVDMHFWQHDGLKMLVSCHPPAQGLLRTENVMSLVMYQI